MPPSPATADFSRVLPNRPIKVRPPQTIGPLSSLGLFTLLFGLLGSALWCLAPDLARDWRVGGEVVRAEGVRIEEARCRNRLFAVTMCDITVLDERGAEPARRTLWYVFFDRAEREPVVAMRAKSAVAGVEAISTNLGLDKFYNRLLALVVVVALLGFCIVLSAQVLWQGILTHRALAGLSGQRLRPVVVGIDGSFPIAHKRKRWTYVYDRDGRQERAFIELVSGNEPLFVTPDGKRALALSGPDGGVPLLLDAKLASLELTETEREAFFTACREALDAERVA